MKSPKRLLLIDDDKEDLFVFQLAVSTITNSVECIVETDSEEVLHRLMENAFVQPPDLIFLDLNMPRVGGMEILAALKSTALYGDVPVIIHSTSTAQKDMEKAKQLGAVYYLPKPSNFTILCESLRELFLYFEILVSTVR